MAFIKRLGYFLVGLSIGIVFLTFFFKKKSEETGVSFCYLPNCRTLKDIRSKPFVYAPEIQQMLMGQLLDTVDIKAFLTDGDVDFGASDTKSSPCKTYIVEGYLQERPATMHVRNCREQATLEKLVFTDQP